MKIELMEDVLDIIEQAGGPVIYMDLVGSLRRSMRGGAPYARSERRWRNIRDHGWDAFDEELRKEGFFLRYRKYAAGLCVYVYTEPFDSIKDRRGKEWPVSEY